MAGGRPRAFKNKEELQVKLDEYKAYLKETGKPPTIAGLAYYTGIDRKTVFNYKKDMEYFPTINNFVKWIMMNYEEAAVDKGNSGVIFMLKNYGYTDKQEIEHSGETSVKHKYETMTDEELEKELEKYGQK